MVNLIIDYDGTLHNSVEIYIPAFKKAYSYLVENNLASSKEFSDSDIAKWLGYTPSDMWNEFMPSLDMNEKAEASNMIGKTMLELINDKKAKLYDGAEQALTKLKESGYNLIFLSNCKNEYMLSHKRLFSLDKYFTEFYCSEDYKYISKPEIFEVIKSNHNELDEYIVIGDRIMDMEIAKKHNLPSIGCEYGFGSRSEIITADIIIENIKELPSAVTKLKEFF